MVLTNRLLRMIGSIALMLCIFIAIGCSLTATQRKHTANFSKATAALAELASNELVQMRDGTIQVNTYRLAAVGEENDQAGLNDLDETFDVEDVKVRVQAVEVLKTYGELLQSLVEETQAKELKKASDKFVASINGLPMADKKMSDLQTEALGQAVYKIGRMIIEAKKAKAVREIVGSTQGQIEHLCELLSNEFDVEEDRLLTQYKKSVDVAITAIRQAFLESEDVLTRLELVELYKRTQANRDRTEHIAKNMSHAIGNLKKANEALNKSLKKQDLSITDLKKLKEYRNSVKEVIDLIKVLR